MLTGETTPNYLFHPYAAQRAADVIPGAKLIVLLRNPVDRAYSHYHLQRRKGREVLSFEDALAAEEQRIVPDSNKLKRDGDLVTRKRRRYSYKWRGVYVDQLRTWFSFFPRERFLIIKSEDLFADPVTQLPRILTFLGIPECQMSEFQKEQAGDYPEMNPNTRAKLAAFFAPYNRELSELLEADFEWGNE